MYEDEPQDRVHDVLAEAIFGDHPLGRRVLGRAEVIGVDPGPGHRRLPRRPLHGRQHRRRGGRPRRARADRRARRAAARRAPARRAARGRRRRRRPSRPRLCFYEKETEQYHICFGGPGIAARRRPPLRARRPRHDLRRLDLLAAVPRGAREARPRLLGRLLHGPVRRPRHRRDVRRHPRGQRRRGLRDHRPRARLAARRRASATTSSRAPRSTSRAAWCSGSSRPARGCGGSRARPLRRPAALARRDARARRRGRRSTRSPSSPPSSTTRPASRPPASAPTRTASATRRRLSVSRGAGAGAA